MSSDFSGHHHADRPKAADLKRFRHIYGLWDCPESTLAYLRGVRVG